MQFKLFFLILLSLPASLPAKDGPETLAWVQQLGVKIENTLHDAILSNDWPNMLVKLMECHDEFDAIALVGLHCHEARIAAELGRNYCNWLNSYVRDKDLNACIIRAQAAREQAHRMIADVAQKKKDFTQIFLRKICFFYSQLILEISHFPFSLANSNLLAPTVIFA